MHSLLRTSSPSIRRFIASPRLCHRPISTESISSSFRGSGCGGKGRDGSNLEWLLRSVVGVVGSSLGLYYWSSVSDAKSFLSFADSRESDIEAENKPKFLFRDAYRRKVFFKYEKRIRMQSPPEKITSLPGTAIESIIRILELQVGQAYIAVGICYYDYKSQGTISANDFALSMVASADMSHINKFLDRVEELNDEPHLRDIRVSLEEFKNFSELRTRLRPLSLAMFSHGEVNGMLTKPDLQRAAHQVCGISLTDNVVNVIFYVFDTNRDVSLSTDEFLRVLQRWARGVSLLIEAGFRGFLSCL